MFTGIIEEKGTVLSLKLSGNSGTIKIKAKTVLQDCNIGDSIAVNGVCLTVTSKDTESFTADVMAETVRRSNLSELKSNSKVNLERAMTLNKRFGGHIVSGHIDGKGTITQITKEENAIWYKISSTPEILKYIIQKGSITIDGISLTVAKVSDTDFSVSVIPHTAEVTTLSSKTKGDIVNLENDIIGKYVEKLINFSTPQTEQKQSKITEEYLRSMGF